jgi:hypothetical protein
VYLLIKNVAGDLNNQRMIYLGIIICVQAPLFEESFFRGILKPTFIDYEYNAYVNSFIFGLVHISNYLSVRDRNMMIYQFIFAAYLGYYLYQFDNIWHSMAVHLMYNTGVFLTYLFLVKYFIKSENIDCFCDQLKKRVYCHKTVRDDFKISSHIKPIPFKSDHICITHDKIPKDMLDRIDKLENSLNNRYQYFKVLKG